MPVELAAPLGVVMWRSCWVVRACEAPRVMVQVLRSDLTTMPTFLARLAIEPITQFLYVVSNVNLNDLVSQKVWFLLVHRHECLSRGIMYNLLTKILFQIGVCSIFLIIVFFYQ